jgi:hypothetical protein
MHRELPARPDLEFYRKEAKALLHAHRGGRADAVARAAAVLGERARARFRLSDAQHVLAVEHGHRSWGAFRRAIQATRPAGDEALAPIRTALAEAEDTWGERGDVVIDTGMSYAPGQPVLILVRKRGHRYDLSDDGAAVRGAGSPQGWLEATDRLVAEEGFNVSRAGVLFVPVVEGRDQAQLVWRLAAASLAVYDELLELG